MAEFTDARSIWDRRFAQADGWLFGLEPNRWLAEHAGRIAAGSRALCIADGEGRNAVHLARAGVDVTAFDLSGVAVDKAVAMAAAAGVRIDTRRADIAEWTWEPDAYDAVVAIFFQFAGPDLRRRIFEGIATTLRPGGLLIIEGYGLQQLEFKTGGPGVADNLYTPQTLVDAFQDWLVLASRNGVLMLEEGTAHRGRSHVISAVLRKPAA